MEPAMMASLAKPMVVRYLDAEGRQVPKGTPGARSEGAGVELGDYRRFLKREAAPASSAGKSMPVYGRCRKVTARNTSPTCPRVSGAKPLRGRLAGKYRLRTGDYRLQFRP